MNETEKKFMKNTNYISMPVGRKWVWAHFRVIGSFTAIDFLIIVATIIFFSVFFFIPSISTFSVVITMIIFLFFDFLLIIEVGGKKRYEILLLNISTIFKKINLLWSKDIATKNKIVYEVVSGIDIANLTDFEIEKISEIEKIFSKLTKGSVKFIKLNSTLLLKQHIDKLRQNIIEEQDRNKKIIKINFLENIEEFMSNKIGSIFLEFNNTDKTELKYILNKLDSVFGLKKLSDAEYNALKISFLGLGEKFKIKKTYIENENNSFCAMRMDFGRNIPSLWMQDFLFNPHITASIELEAPNVKQKEWIRRTEKKWNKTVQRKQIENDPKDYKKSVEKVNEQNAINSVIGNYMFNKDKIFLITGQVILEKDKESELSFRKQIRDFVYKIQKAYNIQLIRGISDQDKIIKDAFFPSEDTRKFPINMSVISNAALFQNSSILDDNGAYLGTTYGIYPWVWNVKNGGHMLVVGQTGSGKSWLLQLLLASVCTMNENVRHIVLDPKSSTIYDAILKKFNGEQIDIGEQNLNPLAFARILDENNFKEEVEYKALEVEEFLKILFNGTGYIKANEIISELSDYIKQFYLKNETKILNGKEYIFSDIYKALDKEKLISKFSFIMSKLINGTFSRFNCKGDVKFNEKKSIVFNLLEVMNLEPHLTNSILFLIMNMVMDDIFNRQDKKIKLNLWIDEANDFLQNAYIQKKMSKLTAKARGFGTQIALFTQNITDFTGERNRDLISIISNVKEFLIGQVEVSQIAELNNMLKLAEEKPLTPAETDWIKPSNNIDDKGKFILKTKIGNKLVKVDLIGNSSIKDDIESALAKKGME